MSARNWLSVDDVMHLRGPGGRDDRQAVQRLFRRWMQRGYPLVEKRPRPCGGLHLVVSRAELEHYLPAWFAPSAVAA